MLKANALFTVIVVSLLAGILCTSLITISYYQRLQVQKNELIKRLHSNAYSGLNILLANQIAESETVMDLFEEERDSVRLRKMNWGIFEAVSANAFSRGSQVSKSLLCGYQPDGLSFSAIYLADQNQPLSLSGKTLIKGPCFLPEAGVKRAYIEGSAFSGKNLIEGEIRKSDFKLPELKKEYTQPIISALETGVEQLYDAEAVSLEKDTLLRSFEEKTILIRLSDKNGLKNKVLEGNIIVTSSIPLELDSTSKLKDILIFSPSVTFKDFFAGSLQVFCSDSILAGQNCRFDYPSVLGIIKKDFKTMQPFIRISKNTLFKGVLFSYANVQDLQHTLISLDKETVTEGQVYADGFLEIKGAVYGNVFCRKFTLKTPSSVYENHLFDATIAVSERSPFYVGSSILPSQSQKKIVKWLH